MSNIARDVLDAENRDPAGEMQDASTLMDMATVLPQAIALEHFDELLEMTAGKKIADKYRKALEEARQDSPVATTAAEMLTPDVLSAVTMGLSKAPKLAKLVKSLSPKEAGGIMEGGFKGGLKTAAESTATSAAIQHGQGGNIDGDDLLVSGVAGGALGTAAGLATPYKAMRKKNLGLEDNFKELRTKMGAESYQDYADEVVQELSDSGFFKTPGKGMTYDPIKGKFKNKRNPISATSDLTYPPSDRDLFVKSKKAANAIYKEMEKTLKDVEVPVPKLGLTDQTDMGAIMGVASTRADKVHQSVVTRIAEDVAEKVASTEKDRQKIATRLLEELSYKFKDKGGKPLSLMDLEDYKADLYTNINFARGGQEPVKEEIYKEFSRAVKNLVDERIGRADPEAAARLTKLRDDYGKMAYTRNTLEKALENPKDLDISPGAGSNSPIVGLLSLIRSVGEVATKTASQTAETLIETPGVGASLEAAKRKVVPELMEGSEQDGELQGEERQKFLDQFERVDGEFSEEEEGLFDEIDEEPQRMSVMPPEQMLEMNQVNLPTELTKMKLPRSTEGLLENKQALKLKFANMAENAVQREAYNSGVQLSPEEVVSNARNKYTEMQMLVDEMPEQLDKALPMLITKYPEMFEDDKYQRINNVVPQSLRPTVTRDIEIADGLSNREKVKKIALLNKTGEYYS